MNRSTRMMMLNNGQRRRIGVEYEDYAPRDSYQGQRMYRTPEGRFRDRDGREHYDDGRFAPMRSEGDYRVDGRHDSQGRFMGADEGAEERYSWRNSPRSWYDAGIHGGEQPMRRLIGFSPDGGFRGEEGMDASYYPRNEMEYRTGPMSRGHSQSGMMPPMDRQMAEEWTSHMQNADGTRGPHFTMEKTKEIQKQYNVNCDPVLFWTVINSLYSDYDEALKKNNASTIEMYACLAKAWIEDADAVPNKATAYYMYVFKH